MRCPECQTKERGQPDRCRNCGYEYVFNRKQDPVRDVKFRKLVDKLRGDGHFAFTRNQLAMELCRATRKSGSTGFVLAAIACALLGQFAFSAPLSYVFFSASALLWIAAFVDYRLRKSSKGSASFKQAKQLIDRFQKAHKIPGLADGTALQKADEQPPPDLLDFPPQHILVVQRDDMVDALVLSGAHAANKAAIVSATGYPKQVFAACRHYLERQPDLQVLVAHDDSKQGRALYSRVKKSRGWAFARDRLVDIGIDPASFKETDYALPWLFPDGKVVWSNKPDQQREKNGVLLLDFARPAEFGSLIGAAMLGGAIGLAMLAPPAGGTDSGTSGDFG